MNAITADFKFIDNNNEVYTNLLKWFHRNSSDNTHFKSSPSIMKVIKVDTKIYDTDSTFVIFHKLRYGKFKTKRLIKKNLSMVKKNTYTFDGVTLKSIGDLEPQTVNIELEYKILEEKYNVKN